jgi:hypothetical protein
MQADKADRMLKALGSVLEREGTGPVDVVICGAMALAMQGIIDRATRDIDGLGIVVRKKGRLVLDKPLMSAEFSQAVERVGLHFGAGKFWFSTAATILHDDTRLPARLIERAEVRHYGKNLTVRLCSRSDMILFKMWAAIKRGEPDIDDLIKMHISEAEAEAAARWCLKQDGEAAPELKAVLEEIGHGRLAERLG